MREAKGSCSMPVSRRWVDTGESMAGRRQEYKAGNLHCICSGRCARVAGRSAPDFGHSAEGCKSFASSKLRWVPLDGGNPRDLGLGSMPVLERVDSTSP